MAFHELVIAQMRISSPDSVDFLKLSRPQRLSRIETPNAPHQALPTQGFMNSCNTSAKSVRRIKKGRIRIRKLRGQLEHRGRD